MIDNLLSYEIRNFIMFSRDAYWATVEQHNADIWPWQILIVLFNFLWVYLCFSKKHLKFLFIFVGFIWIFLANFFFQKYLLQIYWPAKYCTVVFNFYGLLLIASAFFKIKHTDLNLKRHLGLILMLFSIVFPFNLLFGVNDFVATQLFGFGVESTAVGTIGFLMQFKSRVFGGLALISIGWLILSRLSLNYL